MNSEEIKRKFLEFFESKGYSEIPSHSLILDKETDSSTLFTTAGMQPLAPYLLGKKHPNGDRLVNVQNCVRTTDIAEVGDSTHLTFFQMLGRWTLGKLDKKEILTSTYEFLLSIGLKKERIYASVFVGNKSVTKDEESAEIWKSLGIPVYFRGEADNWWGVGENGPCGPDSEVFYDITDKGLGMLTPKEFQKADDEGKAIEIWNDVFMEYEKRNGKITGKLKNPNVDTGVGFERLVAVIQNKKSVYETDIFTPIIDEIKKQTRSGGNDNRAMRIIADHIRSASYIIADGVVPSNTGRGYVLRRLIRRARYYYSSIISDEKPLSDIYWFGIADEKIKSVIKDEESKFLLTLKKGKKKLEDVIKNSENIISGEDTFFVFSSYGYPIELIVEIAKENKKEVDIKGFNKEFDKHKEISKKGLENKFKGGLADTSSQTTKLHTAHHLLLASLQKVLGVNVRQKGSNITQDRLRLDFSYDRKLTEGELKKVEDMVNQKIKESLNVVKREMKKEDAEKIGAEAEFGKKYPDVVGVYFIENSDGEIFSKEFCGGPHVKNTEELGSFRILKEESSSAGVRRIKAILES